MYTIVETPTFAADAKDLWNEEERGAFCAWLSAHPDAGLLVIYAKSVRGNIPAQILKSIRETIENE